MILISYLKKRYYERKYKNIEYKDVKAYSLFGLEKYCKVVKVYDGDTITIIFKHRGELMRYSCRINHIDAPEIKTKNKREKEEAIKVRDYLDSLINGKIIKVYFDKFDKYGRPLINIRYKGKDLAEKMLKENLVKSYNGGKKERWLI